MTHTTQVLSDEQIIELAVEHNLGRKLRPLGNHDTGNVFYSDASYRTSELLEFTNAAVSATLAALGGQPAYWEWRHLSTHPDTVDFGQWSEWNRVEARSRLHTVDDSLKEFHAYIASGYKYELRALFTLPPAQPAPAPVDERHRAVSVELDRLMLVIESAVRWQDPTHHAAVLSLLKANRAALQAKG